MAIRELYTELLALVAEEEGKEDSRFKHWAKRVTHVDTSLPTGYAFEGEFVSEGTVKVDGPGVYLVCTRRGSRNYQTATYNVVTMDTQGELTLTDVRTDSKTRGWALRILEQVAELVAQTKGNAEEKPVTLTVTLTRQAQADLIAMRKRLDATDEEIIAAALAKYYVYVDAHLGVSAVMFPDRSPSEIVGKFNDKAARARASEAALYKVVGRE